MSLFTPTTGDDYLDLIGDWKDPWPDVTVEKHDGFVVANDAPLNGGSKVRFLDYFVRNTKAKEIVFGCCPATGWAQVSLPKCCNRYGKKVKLFMAYRQANKFTNEQKLGIKYGADYTWVKNGMLTVTKKRAADYAEQNPDERVVFPLGLEHPTVLASIIRVARSLPIDPPKEIWSVGSSGTLNRGLQLAFPKAKVHVVSVGHTMKSREIGRAFYYKSPYKFDQKVKDHDAPPFSSVLTYDAKVWPFVKAYAKPGALVWNVAGDVSQENIDFDVDKYEKSRIIVQ